MEKRFNLNKILALYDVSKKCLLRLLRREMGSDITHDLVKKVHISKTLPTHPFAGIAFKHRAMSTVLSFVSLLRVFPWVLCFACEHQFEGLQNCMWVHLQWNGSHLTFVGRRFNVIGLTKFAQIRGLWRMPLCRRNRTVAALSLTVCDKCRKFIFA